MDLELPLITKCVSDVILPRPPVAYRAKEGVKPRTYLHFLKRIFIFLNFLFLESKISTGQAKNPEDSKINTGYFTNAQDDISPVILNQQPATTKIGVGAQMKNPEDSKINTGSFANAQDDEVESGNDKLT